MSDAEVIEERYGMERGADGVKCKCGGYADLVDTTHEENMKYDCGRYQMHYRMTGAPSAWSCCARAFKCAVCGTRIVGTQAAPEMD
jgi:hypothetical protein